MGNSLSASKADERPRIRKNLKSRIARAVGHRREDMADLVVVQGQRDDAQELLRKYLEDEMIVVHGKNLRPANMDNQQLRAAALAKVQSCLAAGDKAGSKFYKRLVKQLDEQIEKDAQQAAGPMMGRTVASNPNFSSIPMKALLDKNLRAATQSTVTTALGTKDSAGSSTSAGSYCVTTSISIDTSGPSMPSN